MKRKALHKSLAAQKTTELFAGIAGCPAVSAVSKIVNQAIKQNTGGKLNLSVSCLNQLVKEAAQKAQSLPSYRVPPDQEAAFTEAVTGLTARAIARHLLFSGELAGDTLIYAAVGLLPAMTKSAVYAVVAENAGLLESGELDEEILAEMVWRKMAGDALLLPEGGDQT